MDHRTYWLDLFSVETWREFLEAGATVSGFSESRWSYVQRIKPGDCLLCYLTGLSRFIAVLEVTSEAHKDATPIWKGNDYPCRVKVKVVAQLTPETAIPVRNLASQLSFAEVFEHGSTWGVRFQGSPRRWELADGEIVAGAIREAAKHPVVYPIDPAKLRPKPKALETKIGPVTIPTEDEPLDDQPALREHIEIQWLLLKLGSDMGFDVWVATNDKGLEFKGQKFSAIARLTTALPLRYDNQIMQVVELIDVIWLRGNSIVAAFEIESTTSIYSGILRMTDLLALQPNLNTALYLVAPDSRRDKVFKEVNRPTFAQFKPKIVEVCRYISFSALRAKLLELGSNVRFMRPEFLEELSESCTLEES